MDSNSKIFSFPDGGKKDQILPAHPLTPLPLSPSPPSPLSPPYSECVCSGGFPHVRPLASHSVSDIHYSCHSALLHSLNPEPHRGVCCDSSLTLGHRLQAASSWFFIPWDVFRFPSCVCTVFYILLNYIPLWEDCSVIVYCCGAKLTVTTVQHWQRVNWKDWIWTDVKPFFFSINQQMNEWNSKHKHEEI